MESVEPESRLSQLGEKLQRLHPAGWMGKLLRWSGGEQGGDGVSGDSSNDDAQLVPGNAPDTAKQQSGETTSASAALDEAVRKAMILAAEDNDRDAEHEPGSRVGRLLPAVVASPARSQDPRLASPDWRLLAPLGSDEYKDAIANPVTTLDKQYRRTIRLVNALAPHREEAD